MHREPRSLATIACAALACAALLGGGNRSEAQAPPLRAADPCKLRGRVKVVTAFADYKIKIVTALPDLRVQKVSSLPTEPGKWQFVDALPDFTVQVVDAFPDFTVQYVDAFPGCR